MSCDAPLKSHDLRYLPSVSLSDSATTPRTLLQSPAGAGEGRGGEGRGGEGRGERRKRISGVERGGEGEDKKLTSGEFSFCSRVASLCCSVSRLVCTVLVASTNACIHNMGDNYQ